MIFTNTDVINRIVAGASENTVSTPELINHEIINFKTNKTFQRMLDGVNYYEGKHDVLRKQRKVIGEDGKAVAIDNLPNSKQVDNQYRKMVKQKTNYLVGKPLSIQADNEEYLNLLNQQFHKGFYRTFKNITKDSLNCGIGWLYVYCSDDGELQLKRLRPYEIIPGWADVDHTQLEYVIRFYDVDVFDGKQDRKLTKVEYYTMDGVAYYEYYNGALVACDPYHEDFLGIDGETYNWSRLPFVAFKYNDEELPLITNCKSLQDGLNAIISNFQDNMEEDARNTIIVLVNYDGQELGEFRRNLATYGAIKVATREGVTGDVRTLQIEVNADNYKAIIDIFKKAIIENCMGYDAKDEKMSGSPNQMNIQSMYNDIDLDASDMETEYQAALEELLWFINVHLIHAKEGDFTGEKVNFVFNTDMPMDESTTIQNIQHSVDLISDETLIANHPWVTDPQAELERLKEQKKDNMETFGLPQENPGNAEDEGGDPVDEE